MPAISPGSPQATRGWSNNGTRDPRGVEAELIDSISYDGLSDGRFEIGDVTIQMHELKTGIE
jgi:hypothetical protein